MSRKTDEFFNQITSCVENETHVRVHFNSHIKVPVVGKFVYIEDWLELQSKEFVRFVTDGSENGYKNANEKMRRSYTLLYKVSDFLLIKPIV